MSELLPCPFCGGEATRLDGHYDFGGEWFETGCDNVGCKVLPSIKTLSRSSADESWNTRKDVSDALVAAAREEALREAAAIAQQKHDAAMEWAAELHLKQLVGTDTDSSRIADEILALITKDADNG